MATLVLIRQHLQSIVETDTTQTSSTNNAMYSLFAYSYLSRNVQLATTAQRKLSQRLLSAQKVRIRLQENLLVRFAQAVIIARSMMKIKVNALMELTPMRAKHLALHALQAIDA